MASGSVDEPQQLLKYQKWVLKVPIHCEGCKRKVKKVLQSIDGVYTTIIDPLQQKVTVTGNVKAETLIKKLLKTGKHAEMLPESFARKEMNYGKTEKDEKGNNRPIGTKNIFSEEKENPTGNLGLKPSSPAKQYGSPTSGSVPAGKNSPAMDHNGGATENREGGHGGKKKKKKEQKGNNKMESSPSAGEPAGTGYLNQMVDPAQVADQINLDPPRQHYVPYAATYIPDPAYVANYYVASPSKIWCPTNYLASSTYTYAYMQPNVQATPLDPFQIFSDENPSVCHIM